MSTDNWNGWVNRETWLMNLWLTNDESTYTAVRGLNPVQLEQFVGDLVEEIGPTDFFLDLIHCAMLRVHWSDIAESLGTE